MDGSLGGGADAAGLEINSLQRQKQQQRVDLFRLLRIEFEDAGGELDVSNVEAFFQRHHGAIGASVSTERIEKLSSWGMLYEADAEALAALAFSSSNNPRPPENEQQAAFATPKQIL